MLCLVSHADFKANDIFKVEVTCSKQCSILLEVYMNTEINLTMNGYTQVEFHMNAAGVIINSKLPENVFSFSEVSIIATIDNPNEVTDGFKMKAAVGYELDTANLSYNH